MAIMVREKYKDLIIAQSTFDYERYDIRSAEIIFIKNHNEFKLAKFDRHTLAGLLSLKDNNYEYLLDLENKTLCGIPYQIEENNRTRFPYLIRFEKEVGDPPPACDNCLLMDRIFKRIEKLEDVVIALANEDRKPTQLLVRDLLKR